MKRLFFSIYLALIASLALFTFLVGLFWYLYADRAYQNNPRSDFIVKIAEKYIAQNNQSHEDLQKSLNEWSELSGFELGLLDKNSEIIVKTENFEAPRGRFLALSRFHSAKLSEGRVLQLGKRVVKNEHSPFYFILIPLFGLGVVVAMVAYPVVRRITKRLERLTEGVALMGEQRGVRVEIEGCDECAVLAKTFNLTSEKLDNLILSQKSLLANASHELRSPLARLRMAVEGVSVETPPSILMEIRTNISELDALIEEVLLASRLEAQGISKEKEAVDLIALLHDEAAVFHVKPLINTEKTPYILGETRLLRRLLRNLLENAQKHGAGQEMHVTLSLDHKAVTIDIEDNGVGVPEPEREKIFEAFYRKAGHGEIQGGVGLGLSLVRRIAREHGGEVICLSRENQAGANFRVTLPHI